LKIHKKKRDENYVVDDDVDDDDVDNDDGDIDDDDVDDDYVYYGLSEYEILMFCGPSFL
jgi:hypothetical protein